MRPAPDFSHILDEKLETAAFVRASPREPVPGSAWRPGARPVFLFGDLHSGFSAGPGRPAHTSGASPWTPVYGARPEAQPRAATPHLGDRATGPDGLRRPPRRLTAAQQEALGVLRTLGVGWLCDGFTDAQVKSAFRHLARRFHPDRHPGSTAAERASLARSFAAACDAYRTLTTAVH